MRAWVHAYLCGRVTRSGVCVCARATYAGAKSIAQSTRSSAFSASIAASAGRAGARRDGSCSVLLEGSLAMPNTLRQSAPITRAHMSSHESQTALGLSGSANGFSLRMRADGLVAVGRHTRAGLAWRSGAGCGRSQGLPTAQSNPQIAHAGTPALARKLTCDAYKSCTRAHLALRRVSKHASRCARVHDVRMRRM